jgi:hypothetical protein
MDSGLVVLTWSFVAIDHRVGCIELAGALSFAPGNRKANAAWAVAPANAACGKGSLKLPPAARDNVLG